MHSSLGFEGKMKYIPITIDVRTNKPSSTTGNYTLINCFELDHDLVLTQIQRLKASCSDSIQINSLLVNGAVIYASSTIEHLNDLEMFLQNLISYSTNNPLGLKFGDNNFDGHRIAEYLALFKTNKVPLRQINNVLNQEHVITQSLLLPQQADEIDMSLEYINIKSHSGDYGINFNYFVIGAITKA